MSGYIRQILKASFRQGWPYYLTVIAVFALGLTAGAFSAGNLSQEQIAELQDYLTGSLKSLVELPPGTGRDVRDAAVGGVATIGIMYCLGLTIIGFPLVLAFIFSKGFVLGFAVSFLTAADAMEGLVMAAASVLPHNLLLVPALLIGGVASLSFTALLWRRFFDSGVPVWPGFVGYTALMTAAAGTVLGAVLIEVYVVPVLTRLAASYLTKF